MDGIEKIQVRTVSTNNSGSLSFFEGSKDIPFQINRIYYIHNVPKGVARGGHAHRDLQQMLFCPFGSIKILLDNGIEKESIILDTPEKGIIIQRGIWRDMIWEKADSVLCVAASAYYEEADYVRDYEQFTKLVEMGYWNDKYHS